MAALEKHRAAWLVLHERTRLARDVDLAGYFRTLVRMAGAEVVTTDSAGKSLIENQITDVLGAQERREIGARTKRALAEKKAKGLKYSRHTPFGFRATRSGRLEEHPEEQEALARMKLLRRRGKNYYEIAADLTEKFQPRAGAKAWYPASIRKVLLVAGVKGPRVRFDEEPAR